MSAARLAARNLTKRFGERTAVDSISFEVHPGEAVGLLGPNGAGKTTTLSMITGLLRPDSGEVWIDGRPLSGDTDPRKGRLGLSPQDLALQEVLSARANLELFAGLQGMHGRRRNEAISAALGFVNLLDRASEPVRQFSGGMKRRLNLAAALVHNPDTLLLDEPTVGVDPQSRNAIFENIAALQAQGKTIVYTTHYMEEVERLCSRVIIIDQGRVIADDTVRGLKRRIEVANRVAIRLTGTAEPAWLPSVQAADGIEAVEFAGELVTVLTSNLGRGLPAALSALAACGADVASVTTQQPSLEDAFLNLTGRSLRD